MNDHTLHSLMHYGVLGMRWGVRRARNNLAKARKLKTTGQKEKGIALETKAKRSLSKHTRRSGRGTVEYTQNESLGKTVVKTMLMGTYGVLRYNEARAKGAERGGALINAILYQIGNQATGGLMSIAEPRSRL